MDDDAPLLLVGADEAGYGPQLGPLCLATALVEATDPSTADPAEALEGAVTDDPTDTRRKLLVCDSKRAYGRRKDVGPLEETVLAWLAATDPEATDPATAPALLRRLEVPARSIAGRPWYADLTDVELPRRAIGGVCRRKGARLREALAASGMRARGLRALVLPAEEFNRGIAATDNKATLHTALVLGQVRAAVGVTDGPVRVVCDRLGGRMRYGPHLDRCFPGARFKILEQTPARSAYRLAWRGRTLRISFRKGGEEASPLVALASMTAKYLRELLVARLNAFFTDRDPTIRPTAGYHGDSKRFLRETDDLRAELAIRDEAFVRVR